MVNQGAELDDNVRKRRLVFWTVKTQNDLRRRFGFFLGAWLQSILCHFLPISWSFGWHWRVVALLLLFFVNSIQRRRYVWLLGSEIDHTQVLPLFWSHILLRRTGSKTKLNEVSTGGERGAAIESGEYPFWKIYWGLQWDCISWPTLWPSYYWIPYPCPTKIGVIFLLNLCCSSCWTTLLLFKLSVRSRQLSSRCIFGLFYH
jgi:hypothetical protein